MLAALHAYAHRLVAHDAATSPAAAAALAAAAAAMSSSSSSSSSSLSLVPPPRSFLTRARASMLRAMDAGAVDDDDGDDPDGDGDDDDDAEVAAASGGVRLEVSVFSDRNTALMGSLAAQVNAFAGADAVVAMQQGAGLAHVQWCARHAFVGVVRGGGQHARTSPERTRAGSADGDCDGMVMMIMS